MDNQRFDNLTRALAGGASRRRLLKGMLGGLGGLAAAAGWRSETTAQGADPGAPCTRARDCASFRCVDGYCCDTSCSGQCEACNVVGAEGTCTPVAGPPVGDRPACPGTDVCQASCDGVTGAQCTAYPGPDVVCADPVCEDVWLTTYGCGGNGSCHPTTTSCFPYRCAETACGTTCTTDAECADGASCVEGQCVAELPLGEECTADAACQSGFCVNGVCCIERCGVCETCSQAGSEGTCTEFCVNPGVCTVNGFSGPCDCPTLTAIVDPSSNLVNFTSVSVEPGAQVRITATGFTNLCGGLDPACNSDPSGDFVADFCPYNLNCGSLIAFIGDQGVIRYVGEGPTTLTGNTTEQGLLGFHVNDRQFDDNGDPQNFHLDNTGSYTATIECVPQTPIP